MYPSISISRYGYYTGTRMIEIQTTISRVRDVTEIDGWLAGIVVAHLRFSEAQLITGLSEFVKIPETSKEALKYIEKYGRFEVSDTKCVLNGRVPKKIDVYIRRIQAKHKKISVGFARPLAELWNEREAIRTTLKLMGSFIEGKQVSRERLNEVEKILEMQLKGWKSKKINIYRPSLKTYQGAISRLLSRGARDIVLRFSPDLRPVVSASDLRTGFYLSIWTQLVRQQPLSICPRCGKLFVINRPKKTYCSERCRQAYKQQKRREKEKKIRK